ncbi:ROK family transcriptional regulator [Paenibacillus protaetiae]|uniref:ROK family transcriptional regulator n=1 Tax=Paenibacillus protaetiae TaxID=2509456 RepID=A0A4P6ETR4_9BACL|nr:ROK family transcriptional regulator [Paenibacillus protaetiae]QAY66322.1 ROK family transcriptional regulator [Paenibacillus protaetiae]
MDNKKNRPGTPNMLRLVNRNAILTFLEQAGITSRAELSAVSGISPPTVSSIVKELMEEGWIHNAGGGVSHGGKPPQLIKLNPDARFIGAVQMNADKFRIRLSNLAGQVYAEEQFKPSGRSVEEQCRESVSRLTGLMQAQQLQPELWLGVCVVVPGVVNDEGIVSNAPELHWHQEPILHYYTACLSCPVVVENDVNLAAIGDSWKRKAWAGMSVYIHLDRGIGAGILLDGKLYKGAHFAAGEIGSLIVDPATVGQIQADPYQSTGRFGYFEAQFGYKTFQSQERNIRLEDRIIQHIAYAMVNIIVLLDPDTLVFGGRMAYGIDNFLGRLSNALAVLVSVTPKMHMTSLGDDASLFGAGRAVIENYRSQGGKYAYIL